MNKRNTIRLAKVSDAFDISEMAQDYIEHGLEHSWTVPRVVRNIEHKDTVNIVVEINKQVIGFAIMYFAMDEAHLLLLAIRADYQREGYGTKLMQWLEKTAQVAGIKSISLEVREDNLAARKFYASLGYEYESLVLGYYQGKESAVRMIRNLAVNKAES